MAAVKRFEDLATWRLAVEVQTLADAAAPAPRNIAEGFGRFGHAANSPDS
jgi:hypothetical protein